MYVVVDTYGAYIAVLDQGQHGAVIALSEGPAIQVEKYTILLKVHIGLNETIVKCVGPKAKK